MVPSTHAMMLNRLPKSAIGIIAYVFIPARAVPPSQPGAMGRSDYPPLPALAPSPRPGGPPWAPAWHYQCQTGVKLAKSQSPSRRLSAAYGIVIQTGRCRHDAQVFSERLIDVAEPLEA
jgi:hypothetical protein